MQESRGVHEGKIHPFPVAKLLAPSLHCCKPVNFKLRVFACGELTAYADPNCASPMPQARITLRRKSTSGVERRKYFPDK